MRQHVEPQHRTDDTPPPRAAAQARPSNQQQAAVGHDFSRIGVRDATATVPPVPQAIGPQYQPPAIGFEPDHEFFEFLAHEAAYENKLANRYLYKSPAPVTLLAPIALKNGFGLSDVMPSFEAAKPPYTGPEVPLIYYAEEVTGSDPLNETHGLVAYALRPVTRKDAPRILVFRGTEAFADAIADANKKGPGAESFRALSTQLVTVLQGFAASGGPVVVTGHSLGGALAQLATAAAPGLVSECVTFNSPGISSEAVKAFKAGAAAAQKTPGVTHYITRGDVVSTVGDEQLPGETVMFEDDATRTLAEFHNDAQKIALATEGIRRAHLLVEHIAVEGIDIETASHALLDIATLGDEMDALLKFAKILKELHTRSPLQGSVPVGTKRPKDMAYQSYPPTETIPIAPIEQARQALGAALMNNVDSLEILPLQVLERGVSKTLAERVLPILRALTAAIAQQGGLRGLIRLMLYVDPKAGQMTYWMKEVVVRPK